MVTDQQVRRLFDVRNKYDHLYQAADVAGMSSKTARKYFTTQKLPNQNRVEYTWQNREGPFETDWDRTVQHLIDSSQGTLQATEPFKTLQRMHPDKYQDGKIRTLQRRVKAWKALHGPAKKRKDKDT